MIIDIPENEENKVDYCYRTLALYALERYSNRKDCAKFMGIGVRTLQLWINRYPELNRFKIVPGAGNDSWKNYTNESKWKAKPVPEFVGES